MLTEANGVPVGLAVAAANVPDMKLVAETLASVPVPGPEAGDQHLCLDKGYDFDVLRSESEEAGYAADILRRLPRRAKEAAPPDADPAAKKAWPGPGWSNAPTQG